MWFTNSLVRHAQIIIIKGDFSNSYQHDIAAYNKISRLSSYPVRFPVKCIFTLFIFIWKGIASQSKVKVIPIRVSKPLLSKKCLICSFHLVLYLWLTGRQLRSIYLGTLLVHSETPVLSKNER